MSVKQEKNKFGITAQCVAFLQKSIDYTTRQGLILIYNLFKGNLNSPVSTALNGVN